MALEKFARLDLKHCTFTVWKLQNFSATEILREINFGHVEVSKTAIWTIYPALNFEFLAIFDIFKREIPKK